VSDTGDRVRRLREQVNAANRKRKKENAESWVGRTSHHVQVLQKFFTSVARVAVWLWWNFGNPFLNKFTVPVFMFMAGWYVRIWNKYVFPKDEFGVEHFSVVRGGKLLVGTVVAAVIGWNLLVLSVDATMFVLPWTSQHNETVYLFGTTDNSFADDNWSVTGCEIQAGASDFECSNEDTLYYRIQPNLFNYLWNVSWHGWNPFALFLPEVVGAPVAPGWNECRISAYGIRWKLLVRNLQWYVNLLATDCKPILLNRMAAPNT